MPGFTTLEEAQALAKDFAGEDKLDPQAFVEYLLGEQKMERSEAAWVMFQLGCLAVTDLPRALRYVQEIERIRALPADQRIRAALDSNILG